MKVTVSGACISVGIVCCLIAGHLVKDKPARNEPKARVATVFAYVGTGLVVLAAILASLH